MTWPPSSKRYIFYTVEKAKYDAKQKGESRKSKAYSIQPGQRLKKKENSTSGKK